MTPSAKIAFDDGPVLIGPSLELRPLRATDEDDLTRAASDERTWSGHPAKDRYKPEVFRPRFKRLLDSGGVLAVLKDGEIIGCSRYYAAPDQPDDISIGFTFLNSAHWGGEVNFELKMLMLDHAFRSFDKVWFHISPINIRSQKATAKLGAVHQYDATIDISGSAELWTCWSLDRAQWRDVKAART